MQDEFWNAPLENFLGNIVQGRNQFLQHEVIELLGIKPYQLRFWESEFEVLHSEARIGTNFYSANDLKILCRLKKLLLEDQLTIEKAKAILDAELQAKSNDVKEETIIQKQEELANSFNGAVDLNPMDVESRMNMSSLLEEMSNETFQIVEKKPTPENDSLIQIKEAISKIRTKLREQFKLLQ